MFTGIIQAVGRIASRAQNGGDCRLEIDSGMLPMDDVAIGDSIAVDGVCLTVVERLSRGFAADVSRETLSLTTLGDAKEKAPINLERSLTLGQSLGGHLVSGHVDGIGRVHSRGGDARSVRFVFEAPGELARYIARKGSISINGVSLTVNEVNGSCFGVNVIPHTLEMTNLGGLKAGSRVNLEVDLLARYLERLQGGVQKPGGKKSKTSVRKKPK